MAHAHCMLDTKGYKPTLGIFNTYCFPTTTMVAGRSLMLPYTYIACHISHNLVTIFVIFMIVAGDV
jgi:hypothetical protein